MLRSEAIGWNRFFRLWPLADLRYAISWSLLLGMKRTLNRHYLRFGSKVADKPANPTPFIRCGLIRFFSAWLM